MLPRLPTVPDLLAGRISGGNTSDEAVALVRQLKLTKLLLKVTVQRSLGPVQALIPPEATLEDLIAADAQDTMEEEKSAELWERIVDFVLVSHEFGLLFEALAEGMDNTNEDLLAMYVFWAGFKQAMMLWKRLYGNNLWVHNYEELEGRSYCD